MVTLPTFLPLSEAARKYGLDEARLRDLVEKGKIRAGLIPGSDEVLVSEDEVRNEAIQEKGLRKEDLPEYQKHAEKRGRPIWILKAAEKYRVPFSTLRGWVAKGYIKIIGNEGKKVLLDEQDVAYCAEIYDQRRGQGKWLFDDNGLPYKPKTGPLAL
jgi:predicted site-specific integrase-resolvase